MQVALSSSTARIPPIVGPNRRKEKNRGGQAELPDRHGATSYLDARMGVLVISVELPRCKPQADTQTVFALISGGPKPDKQTAAGAGG